MTDRQLQDVAYVGILLPQVVRLGTLLSPEEGV